MYKILQLTDILAEIWSKIHKHDHFWPYEAFLEKALILPLNGGGGFPLQ